jgi:hypothetical protein
MGGWVYAMGFRVLCIQIHSSSKEVNELGLGGEASYQYTLVNDIQSRKTQIQNVLEEAASKHIDFLLTAVF